MPAYTVGFSPGAFIRDVPPEDLATDLDAIAEDPGSYARHGGFGAHDGTAGVALAAQIVAELTGWEEPHARATALKGALMRLDPAVHKRHDERYDVVGGVAGTILAVAAMTDEPGDDEVATFARWANTLAAGAIVSGSAGRDTARETDRGTDVDNDVGNGPGTVWPSLNRHVEWSYAHGSAGIIHALRTAASRARGILATDQRYAAVVTDAVSTLVRRLASESSPCSSPASSRSSHHSPLPPLSWCSGSVGHLCGLEPMPGNDHADVLDELRRQSASVDGDRDLSMCCGLAGRLEYWRSRTGQRPRDPRASEAFAGLRQRFVETIAASPDARTGRAPSLPNRPDPSIPAPGLYQGDAGIAWTLAAVAAPSLPVLQCWDRPGAVT